MTPHTKNRDRMETVEQPRIYTTHDSVGLQAALCLAGGIGLVLLMVALFVFNLALPNKAQDNFLPGFIGGTSILWIGLIGRGIFLLRSVRQVMIDSDGVHLHGFISRRTLPWNQIDRIGIDKKASLFGGKSHEVLTLFDANGKPLGQIPDTIHHFQSLGHDIAERSATARGHATYDTESDEARQFATKMRKSRLLAVLAGLLALGMGAGFVWGLNDELHVRRYATEGQMVEAKLTRRYMQRVTPYVEYSFTDSAGQSHSRSVMMNKEDWDDLVFAKTIPVEYLRSDPEWNRPLHGEDSMSLGGPFVWLSGGISLVFAFFCVTSFFGYDLKIEDGVTRITRGGRTIREWGGAKAKPTFGLNESVILLEEEDEPEPEPEQIRPSSQSPTPPKPTGLLALGICALVFGVLGAGIDFLRVALMHNLSVLAVWSGIDALLAILLIVVGAGIIGMRLWSRSLGIVVAALQLTSSIAALVYLIVTSVRAPEVAGEQAMFLTAQRIGAGFGEVLGAVFPVVLLVILLKKTTKDALLERQSVLRVND